MEITQSEIKEYFNYDKCTGVFTWKKSRGGMVPGDIAGSIGVLGYVEMLFKNRYYRAHRLAWFYVHGEFPKMLDHIDGDRSNNRIDNLRVVDASGNQQNQRKAQKHNKTGLIGASFNKDAKKYKSQIGINGKVIFIGYFSTAEEAHQAYIKEKRKHHFTCSI